LEPTRHGNYAQYDHSPSYVIQDDRHTNVIRTDAAIIESERHTGQEHYHSPSYVIQDDRHTDVIRGNSISQNARHTGHDQHYHSPSCVIQDENIIRENPVVKRHSIYQGDPSQRNTSVGLSDSTPYTSRVRLCV